MTRPQDNETAFDKKAAGDTPKSRRQGTGQARQNAATLSIFLSEVGGFIVYVAQRFQTDRMQQRASALTFTTLLAIVPLLAVSFAIFAAFPAFERLRDRVQDLIFNNFVPQVGTEVQSYLESFTAKTGSLTAVGTLFLALSAVMLLMTISGAFNEIWRARPPRSIVLRLLVAWAVLTLTPLFFGASLSLSSYLFALAQSTGVGSVTGELAKLAGVIPFLLQAAGFTILFMVVPNAPVRRRDAVIGGLAASILFELLKKGFGLYVTHFPTYQTIYGAMATVPIFLLWVFMCWIMVLFAAELTAALPEWRAGSRDASGKTLSPTRRLEALLSILHQLARAARTGTGIPEKQLVSRCSLSPFELNWALRQLEGRRYITKSDTGRWHLSRDLSGRTLKQLIEEFSLGLSPEISKPQRQSPWAHRLAGLIRTADKNAEDSLALPLSRLVDDQKDDGTFDSHAEQPAPVAPPRRKGFWGRVLGLIGLGALTSTQ